MGGWLFPENGRCPPPHRRGPVGTTPRTKNNILNRLQESNYTPYACLGTTYGTEISSRSQPCHRLDQKTEKNAAFWQKRPKMARFGVHPLFGPRPPPILPRAGVESKKGAKCDIIRRQDAKRGSPKQKNELRSKMTFFSRVFLAENPPKLIFLLWQPTFSHFSTYFFTLPDNFYFLTLGIWAIFHIDALFGWEFQKTQFFGLFCQKTFSDRQISVLTCQYRP